MKTSTILGLIISIHAPRGGSDLIMGALRPVPPHFNPRSPWGERRWRGQNITGKVGFQSTLPVGGATKNWDDYRQKFKISIHAPRGGSDGRSVGVAAGRRDFNPRSPWGERPRTSNDGYPYSSRFQSTLPVGGATDPRLSTLVALAISIHAPRGGSDLIISND